MISLELLAAQVENFIEDSGDDISSVINHGSVIVFSHVSLIEKNFTYQVSLYETGVITLTKQQPSGNKSCFSSDVSEDSTESLLEEILVKEEKAYNIQDVIAFVMSA